MIYLKKNVIGSKLVARNCYLVNSCVTFPIEKLAFFEQYQDTIFQYQFNTEDTRLCIEHKFSFISLDSIVEKTGSINIVNQVCKLLSKEVASKQIGHYIELSKKYRAKIKRFITIRAWLISQDCSTLYRYIESSTLDNKDRFIQYCDLFQ